MKSKVVYVSKVDTKQYKIEFNRLFQKIKAEFVDDFSLVYRLVGSSKRNLVIRHHNKGFDLDYQIMIMKFKDDSNLKNPTDIKNAFFNFIQNKMKSKYNVENSTSAITLKKIVDNEIEVGFDIVIVKEIKSSCEVLKRNSDNITYSFKPVKEYADFKNNVKLIKNNYLWPELRKKYLDDKIKNIENNSNKKSYLILIDSVKTVVDQNL
ncbi:hypothetical protein [Spiroplasma attinicola]|uniref:hypothetical protein n=1 Tax=Spiroplasma attinicola TaxID=2904537 RepID=UPI002022AFDB|nr:hypothetical protein [Spiroplasma sp. JKS002670]MCL8209599.1 hypothetical protein [Spiroplasma sp. JKS002670]